MTTSAPATTDNVRMIEKRQLRALHAALHAAGMDDRSTALEWISGLIGRDLDSRSNLTAEEASEVLDVLSDGTVRRHQTAEQVSVQEAVRRVTYDIGRIGIGKEGTNVQQGYKFRGIDQFVNSLSPILARHGVTLLPSVQQPTVTSHPTSKGGTQFMVIMLVDWRVVGPAGDSLEARTIGQAMDSSDKAANKAMSNAYKYLLAQVFCVPNIGWVEPDADSPQVDTQPGQQTQPTPPQREAQPPDQVARDRLGALDRIAQLAITQGETPEVFTRKFREERGNLTWDQFIQLSPSVLAAFIRRVETYIASQQQTAPTSGTYAGE